MKVSLQTCQVAKTIRVSFEWKYFSFAENVLEDQPEGGKNKRGICGRGWMAALVLDVDIGHRVSIETKSCTTPYRPPALLFFFYFLMILRPGWAPLVLKGEEENHRRRGHPDLVTTYDCGFFFIIIFPRRFPPFAVEGKTRGSLFHRSTSAESVS